MAKSKKSKSAEPQPKILSPAVTKPSSPEAAAPESESPQQKPLEEQPSPKESFESYYLKRVTAEFAEDIDKIRNAPDFSERSVPVLIQALKQSAANFTKEEKERVIGTKR